MPDNITWLVAGGGALIAFWGQIKALSLQLASLLIEMGCIHDEAVECVRHYCWHNMTCSRWGHKTFQGRNHYIRSSGLVQRVVFEITGNQPRLFWQGWRPLIVVQGAANKESSTDNFRNDILKIYFIRGTFNMDQLLIDSAKKFNEAQHNTISKVLSAHRFFIRRMVGKGSVLGRGGFTSQDTGNNSPPIGVYDISVMHANRMLGLTYLDLMPAEKEDPFRFLPYPKEIWEAILEAKRWKDSKSWYAARGLAWRRAWNLFGQPGCGKTVLAKALAEYLDIPLFIFDLASMSNQELFDAWSTMQANAPAMALIEDVDNIFHGRTNILGNLGGGLSFDALLNCLGGVESTTGIFTIITTNHMDKLDEALGIANEKGESSRPGRIDRVLELKRPTEEDRRKIALVILQGYEHFVETIVKDGKDDSCAQFCERCSQKALALFWDNPNQPHS